MKDSDLQIEIARINLVANYALGLIAAGFVVLGFVATILPNISNPISTAYIDGGTALVMVLLGSFIYLLCYRRIVDLKKN